MRSDVLHTPGARLHQAWFCGPRGTLTARTDRPVPAVRLAYNQAYKRGLIIDPGRTLCWTLSLIVALGGATGSVRSGILPDPGSPDSHELFLEHLSDADEQVFRSLLDRYDAYAETHPTDVPTLIERCRFLGLASCDEEYDSCPYWDEFEQCQADLETAYPDSADVLLYSLEQVWGDAGLEQANGLLEKHAETWDDRRRARLHQKIALLHSYNGENNGVVDHAGRAMKFDPEIDLSLIRAQSQQALGMRAEAIATLEANLDADAEYWSLTQKIELLHHLGAYEQAARVLMDLEPPEDTQPNHLLYAKVWRGAGQPERAREALAAAAESEWMQWQSAEVHHERFRFELEHGDQQSAISYYEAFRDEGFSADPFLRHRLRLAASYPRAPWSARDVLGFLAIAGLVLGMILMPLLVILPVHYLGLIRARSRPDRFPEPSRWQLRDGWYALALLILTEIPFLYMEGVTLLEDTVFEIFGSLSLGNDVATIPDESLALGGISALVFLSLGLLPKLRRNDTALFGFGSWSVGRTFVTVFAGFVCLRIALAFWMLIVWIGSLDLSATLQVIEMLRSIGELYGLPVLFLFVCVVVPVVEEILFRGILLEAFRRHLGFGWANLVQALLFAALHESWVSFPYLVALGLVAGFFARRSGSLLSPILLHAINNATVFLVLAIQINR